MVRRVSQKMYYVIQVVSLSGNIMHYGFALLVVVQGCSGGGISTRVTLRNSVIFQSCITDLVAWFYVDGFLRWLVFFVYLSPKSGRLLVNQLHWYEIVGRCWHAFAFSTNGCLHHVCVSVLLREEPLYWSLHSGDHCGVLQKYLSACVGVSLCMEDPKQQDPHPFVLLFVYFLVSCLSSCTS